jgi:hypothetical protein
MEHQVEWSKVLLGRIGRAVDSAMESYWETVVGPQRMWEVVASMTDHRQGGSQLQRMYQGLKDRGYAGAHPNVGLATLDITTGEGGVAGRGPWQGVCCRVGVFCRGGLLMSLPHWGLKQPWLLC